MLLIGYLSFWRTADEITVKDVELSISTKRSAICLPKLSFVSVLFGGILIG